MLARYRLAVLSVLRPPAGRQPGTSSLFIIHFSFACRAQVWNLVRIAPPSSSSPCGEEEERRARCRRRRGLRVQAKMDPCSDKMVLCYVASVCKFGANLNAPYFSFRCRWPGTHSIRRVPSFSTSPLEGEVAGRRPDGRGDYRKAATAFGAHPTLGSPGADVGAGWPHSGQTEGARARPRPTAYRFFTIHSYLLLPRSAPPALAVLREKDS